MSPETGGISTLGLLGVTFIVLKLCGIIHWSWWLVTLPFSGPAVLVAILFIVAFVAYATSE